MSEQLISITEDFPGIKLNEQPLEIVKKFCYLGDTKGGRAGANDSIITRIRNG